MTKRFIAFTSLLLVSCAVFAQENDSIRNRALSEIQVKSSAISASTSIVQTLSAAQLEKLNVSQVADAMKHLAGVQVKDYGGVGGLKTVSIRSLGAHYTTVAIDGITVADYQTGQIDLGRFSIENLGAIRLNIGESDNIFQPARNQALGGLIQLISQTFQPSELKKYEWKAGVKTGSWQLINPFVNYSRALKRNWIFNVSTSFLSTKGDYPFHSKYTTATLKRINSEVMQGNAEINLHGKLKNYGRFNAKIHAFLSERGIPGSVIYHNTYSDEKANDKNIFAQVNYNQPISKKWQFQANAKANQTSLRDWGLNLNSQYRQHEYYLNATLLYTLSEKCSFSWANDAIRSDIQSRFNISNNEVFAARNTWLSSLAGKYETERLTATARLLYQQTAEENFAYSHLSPYLALSMKVFQSLSARIFYKNTYRIPTFGDIYYPSIPNLNLKAENARQFNLGTTWDTGFAQKRGRFSLSADVYFNRIDNKIISQPHYSMIIWTSVNYGKVDIKGVDFRMDAMFQLKKNFSVEANVNYTCQDVRDKTTEINYQHYNAHLPLTPRHIANSSASLQTPWFNFHYNWMYSGARYTNQSNLFDYWLKPYSEHGFSLSYPFVYHKISGQIALECLNLWNTQYNVIPNYPMPGRSFRLGIKMTY